MPIIYDHKLIFQHIPKAAGTAVCDHFGVDTLGHQHMNWYFKTLADNGVDNLDGWANFCILRHPIERFVSAWQMVKREKNKSGPSFVLKERYPKLFSHDSIDRFVDELMKGSVGRDFLADRDSYHFASILSFLSSAKDTDVEDTVIVDNPNLEDIVLHKPIFVLYYNNLEKDFDALSKIVGYKNKGLKIMNANNTSTEDIIKNASNNTIGIIEETFKIDFEISNTLLQERHVSLYL